MGQQIAFADALDAAEQLDQDGQAELIAVLSRRLAERGREHVTSTVAQARREFAAGQCRPMTAAVIVREAGRNDDRLGRRQSYHDNCREPRV